MPLLGGTGPDSPPLGFASLFEAFAKNIIELAQSNRELWASTAIAVSPCSKGGHIGHVYSEHSSFVKFIERNWQLPGTLSARSRDNLPNPAHASGQGDLLTR